MNQIKSKVFTFAETCNGNNKQKRQNYCETIPLARQ